MKIRTYKEAVDLTVEWWVEKSFKTPMNQNNGDKSRSAGLTMGLMNMLATKSQEKVKPKQIKVFKKVLAEELMKIKNDLSWLRVCKVDYGPNLILRIACEESGIDTSVLPCKTYTRIKENNEIEGRYQYGGDWFII